MPWSLVAGVGVSFGVSGFLMAMGVAVGQVKDESIFSDLRARPEVAESVVKV
jgi:hypothetical protein